MNNRISDNIWNILVCPHCGAMLDLSNQCARCKNCEIDYRYTESGGIDLRLQKKKNYHYDCTLGTSLFSEPKFEFTKLQEKNNPEVNFSDFKVPYHLTKETISYFPKAKTKDSLALDLGCGNTVHRKICERAGFEYTGMDYNSDEALILGDAHALPFKDDSFEFILSIAVLEHIRFPFIMMKEAYRVLKPNGLFIGTVAFLEPFHGDSFYHHTHLGTYNSLQQGGFKIEKICPSDKWSVLMAQAKMLFPKMPVLFAKSLVMPIQFLHKIWWRMGSLVSDKASEKNRITYTTGAFTFIARKDAAQIL